LLEVVPLPPVLIIAPVVELTWPLICGIDVYDRRSMLYTSSAPPELIVRVFPVIAESCRILNLQCSGGYRSASGISCLRQRESEDPSRSCSVNTPRLQFPVEASVSRKQHSKPDLIQRHVGIYSYAVCRADMSIPMTLMLWCCRQIW